jgi:orotate phosphoribosyltransferase
MQKDTEGKPQDGCGAATRKGQCNRASQSLTTQDLAARLLTFRRLGVSVVSFCAVRLACETRRKAMNSREELLRMFETAGAIRHGHFELSSGLHSGTYVQCALVLQYPRFAEKLGQALAALFSDARIDAVVSPAMGGVIIGQEVARALPAPKDVVGGGVPAMFVERDASGTMCMRRGFALHPDQHVLVVEDVWTTGGSTQEAIHVVEEAGGRVVAAAALIDRSGGQIEFPVESNALIELKIESYEPDDCPLCRQGSAAVKPGSRFVRSAT